MNRKEMVKLLGEHFGVKPIYMGVPSCNFKIETAQETYIIDRVGRITTLAGIEVGFEELINGATKTQEHEEVVAETKQEQGIEETITFEVSMPMEEHTGATLRNIVNMIASKQPLIKKALDLEENIIEEDYITAINEVKIATIEEFRAAIENIGERICKGIEFDFHENSITFRFYQGDEKRETYIQLLALINENAKAQKYASPKYKATDNEKFTFRTWLVRLGMKGDEYKLARKVLLEGIEGNGAFRSGKPAEKVEVADKATGE